LGKKDHVVINEGVFFSHVGAIVFWLLLFVLPLFVVALELLEIYNARKNYFVFEDKQQLITVATHGVLGQKNEEKHKVDRLTNIVVYQPSRLAWFNAGYITIKGVNHMGAQTQTIHITLGIYESPVEIANFLAEKMKWHEEFKISVDVQKKS